MKIKNYLNAVILNQTIQIFNSFAAFYKDKSIMEKIATALAIVLSIATCFTACKSNKGPNVDNVNIDIRYHDLHTQIATLDKNNLPHSISKLEESYGTIIPFFFSQVVGIDTSMHYQDSFSYDFFNHKDLIALHDTVNQVFTNTQDIQKQLTLLFKRIKVTDTSLPIPTDIYFYSAGLHNDVFLYRDTIVGVGLDRFLGPDFWPYEAMDLPKYVTNFYIKENIPVEVAKLEFNYKYGINFEDKTLLDLMIHEGKMLYYLFNVLPDHPATALYGFSKEQLEWCENNEVFIYKFFTDQNLLFDKNPTKIMRYIAPAPNSMGMPEQSPGKTGAYIGYQIVKDYAEKTQKSVYEVLNTEDNAQKILTIAKYKPKK